MPYGIKRKHIHSTKWDRCVAKVKKKNTRVNPYAICTKSLGEKSFSKKK